MKLFIFFIFFLFSASFANSENKLLFFLDSAYKKNPRLNAERENVKSVEENINISKSEFLPSVSISGSLDDNDSTSRTDQNGNTLANTSLDTETKKISIDQKIFQGFEGYNALKKSKLEVEKAKFQLKNIEQTTILNAASAYFDLIYKNKNRNFNLTNVDLFERQVEVDSARLQKGEITLTDLAQSESSLAGAKAKLIAAETELLSTKLNFERIIRIKAPESVEENFNFTISLPLDLEEALEISKKNNPKLLIAKLDYEISQKNVNIEKAQLSPTASVNYSKTRNNELSSTVDEVENESVKATITWPIISGGKNYSSLKKSKFKKKQSNLILNDTENEVKTDTASAWATFQSAESLLNSTKSQVKAAEIANEGITLEYDSGNTRTTLEVIQSRSLLLTAQISNAKAERDFILSKFKLLATIGNLSLINIKNS
jgi:outer membrane protein